MPNGAKPGRAERRDVERRPTRTDWAVEEGRSVQEGASERAIGRRKMMKTGTCGA